jgi:hypothetical protein
LWTDAGFVRELGLLDVVDRISGKPTTLEGPVQLEPYAVRWWVEA